MGVLGCGVGWGVVLGVGVEVVSGISADAVSVPTSWVGCCTSTGTSDDAVQPTNSSKNRMNTNLTRMKCFLAI